MADLTHRSQLTFGEAMAAVRRAVLEPDEIPTRVMAGAVRTQAHRGPSQEILDAWRIESATGAAVPEVASLIESAMSGSVTSGVVEPVQRRYGDAGVVASVSTAALLATESFQRPVSLQPVGLGLSRRQRLGTSLLGLAQQLHRSFGMVPLRWKALARLDRAVLRWWDAHEGAMAPGRLTGEEKWLAMAALTESMGDTQLSGLYRGFLLRQGWSAGDVESGLGGRLARLRPGYAGALAGVRELVTDGLDRRRVELAGARLAQAAVEELVDLARLARAIVVWGILE